MLLADDEIALKPVQSGWAQGGGLDQVWAILYLRFLSSCCVTPPLPSLTSFAHFPPPLTLALSTSEG